MHSFTISIILSISVLVETNGQISRYKRAAPKLEEITTNHMKLGRVLNAITLQNELGKGVMTAEDVVASIWNFADKKALTKLADVDKSTLKADLEALKGALDGIPNGKKEVVDMTKIQTALDTISGLNETSLTEFKEAATRDSWPAFFNTTGKFPPLTVLVKNDATTVIRLMEEAVVDVFQWHASVGTLVQLLSELTKVTFTSIKDAIGNGEYLFSMNSAIRLARFLQGRTTELDAFSNAIQGIQQEAGSLTALTALDGKLAELEKSSESLKKIMMDLSTRPTSASATPSFLTEHNVSRIFTDLNDDWLKSVFQTNKNRGKLSAGLQGIKKFSEVFGALNQVASPLQAKSGNEKSLNRLKSFVAYVKDKKDSLAKIQDLSTFQSCLTMPNVAEPPEVVKVEAMKVKLEIIIDGMGKINGFLESNREATKAAKWSALVTLYENTTPSKISNTTAWKEQEGFTKTLELLREVSPQITALGLNQTFSDAIGETSKWKNDIDATQAWLTGFGIAANFEMMPIGEILGNANSLAAAADKFKSEKVTDSMMEVVNAISEVNANMSVLKKEAIGMKTGKKSKLSEFFDSSKAISQVTLGIQSLRQLKEIDAIFVKITTIVNSDSAIQSAIADPKNAAVKEKLQNAWANFPQFKTFLEELQTGIDTLEKSLTIPSEKSLKDMAVTYKEAAKMEIKESGDYRTIIEALKQLEDPPQPVKEVVDAFVAFDDASQLNFNLMHASFERTTSALTKLKQEFDEFLDNVKPQPPSPGQVITEKFDYMIVVYILGGIVLIVLIIVIIIFYLKYREKKRMDFEDAQLLPEPPYTAVSEFDYKYSYIKLQDMRLKMNERNEFNTNDLYMQQMLHQWEKVKHLLSMGALVDMPCGPLYNTPLFEAVRAEDMVRGKMLLEFGANIMAWNINGETPNDFGDGAGFKTLMDHAHHAVYKKRKIPPNTARPFKILVINPKFMKQKKRNRISARIRRKITWGYDKEDKKVKINDYTHLVIPEKKCPKKGVLELTEDDPFYWKCYVSWGICISENWLTSVIIDPKYILEDDEFYLRNLHYGDHVAEKSTQLFDLKTNIHRGLPPLLECVHITILDTKGPQKDNIKDWEEVAVMAGAVIDKVPLGDTEETKMPYWMQSDVAREREYSQNCTWILRFEDSKINQHWRSDWRKFTLVGFGFLLKSLFDYQIVAYHDPEFPMDYDEALEDARIAKTETEGKSALVHRSRHCVPKQVEDKMGQKDWEPEEQPPPAMHGQELWDWAANQKKMREQKAEEEAIAKAVAVAKEAQKKEEAAKVANKPEVKNNQQNGKAEGKKAAVAVKPAPKK